MARTTGKLVIGVIMGTLSMTTSALVPFAGASTVEPPTRSFLLRVAKTFNANYAANRDALVYERWDARSRGVISESSYVQRHALCPRAPGAATVESANPVAGNYWTVHYEISGTQLIDYWHYVAGHWRFDLFRSNPSAVRLYRLPLAAYVAQLGCAH